MKIWIFSTFDSNFSKIDPMSLPQIRTILSFVEIQESVVYPIRNSQSFIPITYFHYRLIAKKQEGFSQPLLGLRGLRGGFKLNYEISSFWTHFTSISCSSETARGGGGEGRVEVYIFSKLSSRPIQKLMLQDYGYVAT